MIKRITGYFDVVHIINRNYIKFPCHPILILLHEEDTNDLAKRVYVKVIVSLLCNMLTVFSDVEVMIKGLRERVLPGQVILFLIIILEVTLIKRISINLLNLPLTAFLITKGFRITKFSIIRSNMAVLLTNKGNIFGQSTIIY